MSKENLVTVVLTVYNRTDYLEIALKSVLEQTMSNFEIIIADDSGSRLAESIYKLYESDSRIVYQPNVKTVGIVNSLKKAIQNSKGVFISVLNDDDCWEPRFLEMLVSPLCLDSDRVLAFSDHWIITTDGKLDIAATDLNTQRYKRDKIKTGEIANPKQMVLIDNGVPLAMAAIFRKDALDLDMLVTEVSGAYDFWISCLLSATGKAFYYVQERLTRYRVHAQMETGRRSTDKQLNNIFIFHTLLQKQLFPEYTDYLIKSESFFLYKAGRDNLYFQQFATAQQFFKTAIKTKFDYRYLLFLALSFLPEAVLKKTPFIK